MAVDSAKLFDRDIGTSKGANITASQVKMLKVTRVKLGSVANNLKDNLVLTKVRNAAKNKQRQDALRKKREAELENKKKKKTSGGGKGPKIPGMGMLDGIINGLITVLWGMIVVKAMSWIKNPEFKKFLSNVVAVGKWIANAATWLLESLVSLVDWGYKLYDGGKEWIKNTFGEDAAEKFEGFMDGVKSIVQAVIFVKVIIGGAVKSIIKSVKGVFTTLGTIIKSAYNLAKNVIKTAIKAAKFIIKTAGKVIGTTVSVVNRLAGGTAGKAVNAIKNQTSKIASKVNPKNWKAPKITAPPWWKKGASFISNKASQANQWRKGVGKTLMDATQRMSKYLDDFSKPLKQAGKAFGERLAAGADKLNPMKQIEKLKGQIKTLVKTQLDKNPFVKKIMGWIANKGKGAAKWIGNNIKKIAKNPKLKNIADGLKKSKASSKALGPVDKIITALMALFEYVKGGESPINVILKGLGGLIGYGLGFTAGNALVPGVGGFIGGIAGSVGAEWLATQMLQQLAKHTPLDEIEDPVMGKEDIAKGLPARMLLRPVEHLGDHMKAPNIKAGDDANEISTTASYEEGGEGSTKFISVNMPNTKKSSVKSESKALNSSSSGSKETSGDPKLLLYAGK